MTDRLMKVRIGVAVVLLIVLMFAGTANATIYIYNTDDWLTNLSTGSAITDNIVLNVQGNVLDFGGADCNITSLSGTFEGNGCTITNFSICGGSKNDNVGLIGLYTGKKISNVTISNFSIIGLGCVGGLVGTARNSNCIFDNVNIVYGDIYGEQCVGGLCGYGTGASKHLENCSVVGCKIISTDTHNTGGLVGYLYKTYIYVNESCVDSCEITSASGNTVGGLVGYACYTSVWINTSCVNGCEIYSGIDVAGGLVGYVYSREDFESVDLKNSIVEDCVIKSLRGYSGGCLGLHDYNESTISTVDNCTVRNCVIYSTGGSSPCGGIVGGCVQSGQLMMYMSLTNCTVEYCTVSVQGTNSVGGIAGSFPKNCKLDENRVVCSCIASVGGDAAGVCPVVL